VIEAKNGTKRYGDTVAVDDLTFAVRPGQVTGFLGPNGAGKSTTLRLILGLNSPTSGSVTVNGVPFADRPRGLRHVGGLLDAQDVHGGRSAVAHLSALARGNRLPMSRVDDVLEEVGLAKVARRRIGGYSLGMKQRLGIAGALLGDPPVLLFDEPLNGLDLEGVLWVRGLFRRLAGEGRTVFVSSHMMSEMEHTADQILVIGRGRLIADQSLAEFSARGSGRSVLVRGPDLAELVAALIEDGASVRPETDSVRAQAGSVRAQAGSVRAQAGSVRAQAGSAEHGASAESVEVTGPTAARIGELAHRHRVLLHELATRSTSLEAAFMELTADSVEYLAGETR
jgi:ABC-2 type transport system ATP-binding protein